MGERSRCAAVPSHQPRTGRVRVALAALLVLACAGCTRLYHAEDPGPPIYHLRAAPARSADGMVVSGTEASTRAAVDVLEAGGNAVDAAVAAALVLGVVDPGDSGLGGTTYILVRLADGRASAIDGSSLVPFFVNHQRLAALAERDQQVGAELIASPGSLAALSLAVERYGTRPLAELLAPAIELAEHGYTLNVFQQSAVAKYWQEVLQSDYLRFVVLGGGTQLPHSDDRFCRPELAHVLRQIALHGASEFYRGAIAARIEADVVGRGGILRRGDLASLTAHELKPAHGTYRGRDVLTFPTPGGGGALVEALNILETRPSTFLAADGADRLQTLIEAFHIALLDQHRFTDPTSKASSSLPVDYLAKDYAVRRARLLRLDRPLTHAEISPVPPPKAGEDQTTHVSVVDRWGNAVALTQTLGRFFGCKVVTPGLGFPYNGFLEGVLDLPPRAPVPTDMSPTIVAEDGEVLLVLGSAGSNRIPGIVASVISNVIDRGMDLTDAVVAPRALFGGHALQPCLEIARDVSPADLTELERRGYDGILWSRLPTRMSREARFGSINAIHLDRRSRLLTGVGDPRRMGVARGVAF